MVQLSIENHTFEKLKIGAAFGCAIVRVHRILSACLSLTEQAPATCFAKLLVAAALGEADLAIWASCLHALLVIFCLALAPTQQPAWRLIVAKMS